MILVCNLWVRTFADAMFPPSHNESFSPTYNVLSIETKPSSPPNHSMSLCSSVRTPVERGEKEERAQLLFLSPLDRSADDGAAKRHGVIGGRTA